MPPSFELPIESERLTVRPLALADAVALHELYSDPVAMRHLASNLPATVADSERWVQEKIDLYERTGLSLGAVVEKASGEVIGDAGLQGLDDAGTIEIAARILRRHWGCGYGREVGRALLDAGFAQLDVHRIVGMTAPDNVAAIRAMEQLAMVYEGREEHFGRTWVVYAAHR